LKIGFCCKYVRPHKTKLFENVETHNQKTTTVKWVTENGSRAHEKLFEIVKHNISSVKELVKTVTSMPEQQRMVRLSSEILPLYTHESVQDFYRDSKVLSLLVSELQKIGTIARDNNVRLSFHPGQFTVICSENPNIVQNSLQELEYHAMLARLMGYAKTKYDFKINIHLSGKLGVGGFDSAWNQMSPELRNCLTIENDEFQSGLDKVLEISDKVAIVLDVHHHFVNTGEYISATDPRIAKIKDSWKGVRPVIHYSQSPWEYLQHFQHMPTLDQLLALAPKTKLRAHSDFYNHSKTNEWALSHLEWADMQAESKAKNLASVQLINQLNGA